jgi:ribosomal protein L37AE/L43A
MTTSVNRPPLESLSCVNADCEQYGQSGQNNLIIRKIYGKDQIRYLRCRGCGEEFSERKLTGLWNCKIPEERAIRVSQQLAEGTSLKGTARLTTTHPDTVRRLAVKFGHHADRFHDQQAQDLDIATLEMDEGMAMPRPKPSNNGTLWPLTRKASSWCKSRWGTSGCDLDRTLDARQCQTPERPTRLGLDDRRRSQLPHLVS